MHVRAPIPSSLSADTVMMRVTRLAALALLCTLAISWRLYIPGFRVFALAPVTPLLAQAPDTVNNVLFLAAIASCAWLIFNPRARVAAAVIVACTGFWVLQDANRMQPYNYMYCYTIFIALLCRHRPQAGLDALRLMVSGIYFWAGFHKINAGFYTSVFPWFIQPIHRFPVKATEITWVEAPFIAALLITPFFEALIGVLLLFPRWRKLATGMAGVMLVVVLCCLGPLGHNYGRVVWPWNLYLFLMEFLLFYRSSGRIAALSGHILRREHRAALLSAALFFFAPALAMITPWYSLVGFKLYSYNIVTAEVAFAQEETFPRVPDYIRSAIDKKGRLGLIAWTEKELGNAVYPVPYVFRSGARGLCAYLSEPAKAQLIIAFPPPFYATRRVEQAEPLCP